MDRLELLKKIAADSTRKGKNKKKTTTTTGVKKRIKPITLYPTSRHDKEQSVKEELIKLTKIVRGKYRDLQRNTENMERYLEASAKPLVMPLRKTVIEGIKQSMPLPMLDPKRIKKEEQVEEEEDEKEATQHASTETVARPSSSTAHDASTQTEEELVETYLRKLSNPAYRNRLDSTYGVRPDGKGGTVIGDSSIIFTRTKLLIKGKRFDVTQGLLELLFMVAPKSSMITAKDLESYKRILVLTNAHRQKYSDEKPINANKGKKYTAVIAQLFAATEAAESPVSSPSSSFSSSSGKGIVVKHTYDTNVNSLVNRLRLLTMSKAAGHTAHAAEILQIENLLRMHKIIL